VAVFFVYVLNVFHTLSSKCWRNRPATHAVFEIQKRRGERWIFLVVRSKKTQRFMCFEDFRRFGSGASQLESLFCFVVVLCLVNAALFARGLQLR